jgi:hypothetical protein
MKKFIATLLAAATLLIPVLGLSSCKNNTADTSAPEKTKKAGNEAVDYYFYYPEDWQLDRNDGMISIKYNTSQSTKAEKYASISITTYNLSEQNQGVNDYWNKVYEPNLKSTFTKDTYSSIDNKELQLDGVSAARKGYSGKFNDSTYKFVSVICNRYGYAYLITFTAAEGDYDKTVGALDTIINNFHFTK